VTKLGPVVDKALGNVKELMAVMPELPQNLVKSINGMDIAKFTNAAPEAAAKFTDLLWETIGVLAETDENLKNKVTTVGDIEVNFEATDSPMKGHMKTSGGKLTGGSTQLESATFKTLGPTKVITGLTTGSVDPIGGFMSKQYTSQGSMAVGMKLAPMMGAIAKAMKG
jgi:putative sterol carrier protein